MLIQENLEANCKLALEYLAGKVDQAEISVDSVAEEEISIRQQTIDKLITSNSRKINITVYLNNCQAIVSTTTADFASIKSACDKACEIVKITAPDKHFGLIEKDYFYCQKKQSFLANYDWSLSGYEKIDLAMQAEQIILADSKIKLCESVDVSSWQGCVWQGNTEGLDVRFLSSAYSMSSVCIADDRKKLVRDFDYTIARDPANLLAVNELAASVVQKTVARIGAKVLSTRKVPVLFSAEMTRVLLGYFTKAINGSRVYKQTSFLADCLHKKIFPDFLSIDQSPHLDSTLGSLTFDADGAATSNRSFVKQGVLNSFVLGGYAARRLGMTTTANSDGIQTLLVNDSRNIGFEDLLSEMGQGLYVIEMMGSGVDLSNGDFSQGVFGFWVEDGKIAYPVHQLTIAGNLKDMFNGCVGIANNIDKKGTIQVGSMLVDSMVIAGSS